MDHLGVNALFLIPGEVGGTQTYLVETLRELLPLLKCRCTIFTNSENDAFLREVLAEASTPGGLAFDCLDFAARNRYSRIVREQIQLPRRIRRAGCDVVWSPGYTAPLFCGRAVRQTVSILDMQYRRFRNDLSPVAWLATHLLVTGAAKRCDRIITLSEFAKGEIVRFAGVSPDRISVTPLGADGVVCGAGRSASAHHAVPYILSVAASYPHKDLPRLVRAFGMIAPKVPHRLVMAGGKGLGEKALLAEIDASPFKDRIERMNWVSGEELAKLYGEASVFALPSRYEGFGIPVVEAQKAGLPVVAARCASIPEVAGDAAIFAEDDGDGTFADALLKAATLGDADRKALVERGFANARRFTWRECAAKTLAALEISAAKG